MEYTKKSGKKKVKNYFSMIIKSFDSQNNNKTLTDNDSMTRKTYKQLFEFLVSKINESNNENNAVQKKNMILSSEIFFFLFLN